jgi:type II secretory pathway component PulM
LLLIALAAVYFLVVTPLMDLYAERQSVLENRRMLLPRLQVAAEELPGLRAKVSELRAAAGTRKLTLDGASDAVAAANLQSRIEELAASVGAMISSTESLPAEMRGGYRRIGLRYVLNGPYETLVKLLARLEAATPPLVVDNLHIHGVLRARRGAAATTGLDAGLDVYGYRVNENPVAAKP